MSLTAANMEIKNAVVQVGTNNIASQTNQEVPQEAVRNSMPTSDNKKQSESKERSEKTKKKKDTSKEKIEKYKKSSEKSKKETNTRKVKMEKDKESSGKTKKETNTRKVKMEKLKKSNKEKSSKTAKDYSSKEKKIVVRNPTLSAVPDRTTISATGGRSTHALINAGAERLVFKVKSSNNDDYMVKPVFGFVEPGGTTNVVISRLPGEPKGDRMTIHYAADSPADEPKAAFSYSSRTRHHPHHRRLHKTKLRLNFENELLLNLC